MSEKIRLVKAPLELDFSPVLEDDEAIEREYQSLSESDDDPIGQWLKLAKARGETKESDPVLLNLLIELHRKVDQLDRKLSDEAPARLELSGHVAIRAIGFEHLQLNSAVLRKGGRYYGRIEMPVFPKRDVPLFFTALGASLAKIGRMHDRDVKEWNAYVTARERIMIREMRGQ